MRTDRLLVHQVLIHEIQQGGFIPWRPVILQAGKVVPPPAPLARQIEDLHPVAKLREVRHLDRAGASFPSARDRFMLEGLDELLPANGLRGGHGGSLYRRKNGSANHSALESLAVCGYYHAV